MGSPCLIHARSANEVSATLGPQKSDRVHVLPALRATGWSTGGQTQAANEDRLVLEQTRSATMRVRELMNSAAVWLAETMPGRAGRSSSDDSIRRALLAQLSSQRWWDPDRCDVAVRDGIVQIAGAAASAQEKIATRAAAESIAGVRGVNDHRSYGVPEGGFH
jgi:osmotically-inducible protein OsmY